MEGTRFVDGHEYYVYANIAERQNLFRVFQRLSEDHDEVLLSSEAFDTNGEPLHGLWAVLVRVGTNITKTDSGGYALS